MKPNILYRSLITALTLGAILGLLCAAGTAAEISFDVFEEAGPPVSLDVFGEADSEPLSLDVFPETDTPPISLDVFPDATKPADEPTPIPDPTPIVPAPKPTPAPVVPPVYPREVLYFWASWCGHCPDVKSKLASLKKSEGWITRNDTAGPRHFRSVDVDASYLGEKYRIPKLPAFVCLVDGKEVARHVGKLDEAGLKAFYNSTGDVPKVAKAAPRVHRVGLFYSPSRGQWSWPGDLRHHLQSPPHSLSAATVAGWSDAECIAYHNRWHNRHGER